MSLLEALTGLMIASLLIMMVIGFTSTSTRLASKFDTQATNFRKAREAMEWMSRDVQAADAVLAGYAGETSNPTRSIILKIPLTDANGNIMGGSRIVMYEFENRQLKRYAGNEGDPLVLDRIVVPALRSVRFDYFGVEAFIGDGAKSTFTLRTAPNPAATDEPSVLVSGQDLFQASQASFAGTTLQVVAAPAAGEQVDVTYPLVPNEVVEPDGGNGSGLVELTLFPDKNWKGATQEEMNSLSEINNRILLRNRK